jgi:hypothetical protein
VADALQVVRARIFGYLRRRGVIHIDEETLLVDGDLSERDPALAQLAAAAVSGLAPAGPELRRRPVELVFDGRRHRCAALSRPSTCCPGPTGSSASR